MATYGAGARPESCLWLYAGMSSPVQHRPVVYLMSALAIMSCHASSDTICSASLMHTHPALQIRSFYSYCCLMSCRPYCIAQPSSKQQREIAVICNKRHQAFHTNHAFWVLEALVAVFGMVCVNIVKKCAGRLRSGSKASRCTWTDRVVTDPSRVLLA